MDIKKKRLLLMVGGGAIAALAIAIVIMISGGEKKDRKTYTPEQIDEIVKKGDLNLADMDPGLVDDLLSYRLTEGKVYHYTFKRDLKGTLNSQTMLDLSLGGVWSVHVVKASRSEFELILEANFQNIKGVDMDVPASEKAKKNEGQLVYLKIDRKGNVKKLKFSILHPEEDQQGVLKDLIAAWLQKLPSYRPDEEEQSVMERIQELIPGGENEGPYRSLAFDTQGRFLAEYYLKQEGDNLFEMDKKKLKYVRTVSPISVKSSEHIIAFDFAGGFFTRSGGQDKLLIGPGEFQVDSTQNYNFKFTGTADSSYTEADLGRFTIIAHIFDERAYLAGDDGPQLPAGKARPWKELQNELEDLKEDSEEDIKHKVFHDLTISLKKTPAMAAQAVKEVKKYPSDSDQFLMTMGALSYAGHKEAQAGMVNLYRGGDLDETGLVNILNAFTMMQDAMTPESVTLLKEVFQEAANEEVRDSAGLALGTNLRTNQDNDLRKDIVKKWRAAQTIARKLYILDIIGNSGDPYFLEVIQDAMASTNDQVRQKGVFSLRFMDTDKANDILLRVIGGNDTGKYKVRAVDALAMHKWKEPYYQPMANCVQNEKESNIRIKCARYVLEQQEFRSNMLSILTSIKGQSDTADDFKEYIEQALTESTPTSEG